MSTRPKKQIHVLPTPELNDTPHPTDFMTIPFDNVITRSWNYLTVFCVCVCVCRKVQYMTSVCRSDPCTFYSFLRTHVDSVVSFCI